MMARKTRAAGTTESDEQKLLFEWIEWAKVKYPELALCYHVVNEGRRSYATGRRMVAEGLRKGVPDICLPVPNMRYTALYIELKRKKGGRLSDEQRGWIDALNRVGNLAVVCHGFEEARDTILEYLRK